MHAAMRGRIGVIELMLRNNWGTEAGKFLALITAAGFKQVSAIRRLLPVAQEIANAVFIDLW